MDLLGQVAVAAGPDAPVSKTARAAVDTLRRGVVAYSSVEELTDEDVEDFPADDVGEPVTDPADLPDGAGQDTLPA